MKNIFPVIALCGYLFASCGNNSNSNGTHTHDDGSIHSDHATEQTQPAQESFKTNADTGTVNPDSLKKKQENHTHDHGDGKLHKH